MRSGNSLPWEQPTNCRTSPHTPNRSGAASTPGSPPRRSVVFSDPLFKGRLDLLPIVLLNHEQHAPSPLRSSLDCLRGRNDQLKQVRPLSSGQTDAQLKSKVNIFRSVGQVSTSRRSEQKIPLISAFIVPLVPKLCLGTVFAKLCFASSVPCWRGKRETEFRGRRSQTEFGNQQAT